MLAASILCCVILSADATDAKPNVAQQKLLKTFREEFIEITPGKGKFPKSFTMGRNDDDKTEGPPREVTMAGPFQIAKYEVPQNLYEALIGKNPSRWKGPRNSVEMVSQEEAREFCRRATAQMRAARLIKANQEIRLPTEAEWEYCARAGTTTTYSFGDEVDKLNDHAWSTHNAAGNDPPVGVKKPNPWGLYDIHGYLWEWCADPWHATYNDAPKRGTAWTKDGDEKQAVLRGGSWKDKAERLTSTARRSAPQETRDDAVGLRCVLGRVNKRE